MDKLPFSVYDFFGYLAAGFLLLCAVVAAFVGSTLLTESPGAIVSVLLVISAYIAGQTIANISGYLLERRVVGDWLGRPTEHLFGEARARAPRLFPGYHAALPEPTQDRVLRRAHELAEITAPGGGLFFHCHARVKSRPAVMARLDTFLALYGFARNVAVALLLATLALLLGIALGTAETGTIGPGWWAGAALVGATGMFYRYLKFFRQYGVELFTSYAEME